MRLSYLFSRNQSENLDYSHILAELEELKRDKNELEQKRYIDNTVTRLSEVMRWKAGYTLEKWADVLLSALVQAVDGLQGSLYILEDDTQDLIWLGGFACPQDVQKRIKIGVGLTGQAAKSASTFVLENKDSFASYSNSSLSRIDANGLLVTPLINNEKVEGVLEISWFRNIQKADVELINVISKIIAGNLVSVRTQVRIEKLLTEAQQKQEMLLSQDEEMRQNVEELEATQEEMKRGQAELANQKILLEAINNGVDSSILVVDKRFRILLMNEKSASLNSNRTGGKIKLGANVFELFPPHTLDYYKGVFEKVFAGEKLTEEEVWNEGAQPEYYEASYFPIRDQAGKVYAAAGFIKNITEKKKTELHILEQNQAMEAQQEELRQNLEELEATQEEMKRSQGILAEQKNLTDAVMEGADIFICLLDKNYKLINFNTRWNELEAFGTGKKPKKGSDVFDFIPPELKSEYKSIFDRSFAGETIVAHQEWANGEETRYWESNYYPIKSTNGVVESIAGLMRDVSARMKAQIALTEQNKIMGRQQSEYKHTQQLLQDQRNLTDALLAGSQDFICVIDANFKIVESNISDQNKFTPKILNEAVVGKHILDIFPQELNALYSDNFTRALLGENFENQIGWNISNEFYYFEESYISIKSDNGQSTFIGLILRNVTDRKKQEFELQNISQTFQSIAQNAPTMFCRILISKSKKSGQFIYASEKSISIVGYTPTQLINLDSKGITNLIIPEHREGFAQQFVSAISSFSSVLWEGKILHGNGNIVWMRIHLNPELIDDTSICFNGTMTDITLEKQKEEEQFKRNLLFEQIVSNIPGFIFQSEIDATTNVTRFIYASAQCYEVTGFTPEEFCSFTLSELLKFFEPESLKAYLDGLEKSRLNGSRFFWEGACYRKTGELIRLSIVSDRTVLEDGRIVSNGIVTELKDKLKPESIILETVSEKDKMAARNNKKKN